MKQKKLRERNLSITCSPVGGVQFSKAKGNVVTRLARHNLLCLLPPLSTQETNYCSENCCICSTESVHVRQEHCFNLIYKAKIMVMPLPLKTLQELKE